MNYFGYDLTFGQFLLYSFAALFFLGLVNILLKGFRKGWWKISIKESIRSITSIVGLVWVMFYLLVGVLLAGPFIGYLESQLSTFSSSSTTVEVYRLLPFFFVATLIITAGIILVKSWKFMIWKFTTEEKELLKQDRIKSARKLKKYPWLVRLLYKREIVEEVKKWDL